MESLGDFLCGIFMVMYWIFRILVTALTYLQIDFPFASLNVEIEIVLLFLTLVCIICVFKRVTIGGLIYFITHWAYFGYDLYINMQMGVTQANMYPIMADFIAIILSAFVVLNIIMSKTRVASVKHDVDWFYKGEQYDRELDERADKNNYRIY